jgi:hypothetical protein
MNFVRNEIVDSFLLKLFFFIKCDLFHDVIATVKSIIFKLKTININIYIYIYIYIFKIIL